MNVYDPQFLAVLIQDRRDRLERGVTVRQATREKRRDRQRSRRPH